MPRPEIDIVAYKPAENVLKWVECKTYMHSPGVHMGHVTRGKDQIKVFGDKSYRKIVTEVLLTQMNSEGLLLAKPKVKYCLAAAHVKSDEIRDKMKAKFKKENWELWEEEWIGSNVRKLADEGYEDEIAVVVAQLWERTKPKELAP